MSDPVLPSASTSATATRMRTHRAAGDNLAGRQLVEIERVIVVDWTPKQPREVPNSRIAIPAKAEDRCQLLLDASWKLRLQSALGHGFGNMRTRSVRYP